MKTGRLSKQEKRTITNLIESMTVEDIAKKLDRSFDAINDLLDNVKFVVDMSAIKGD